MGYKASVFHTLLPWMLANKGTMNDGFEETIALKFDLRD